LSVLQDVLTGKESVVEYKANELIVIPARLAHLFEYIEDSYMIEWWDCDFQAWCASLENANVLKLHSPAHTAWRKHEIAMLSSTAATLRPSRDNYVVLTTVPSRASRYYKPYRERIAEQFRSQQAAWQASRATAADGDGKLVQETGKAASVATSISAESAAAAGQSAAQSVAAAADRQAADSADAGRAQGMSTADRMGEQAADTAASAGGSQQAGSVTGRQAGLSADQTAGVSATQQDQINLVAERGTQLQQRDAQAGAASQAAGGSVANAAASSQMDALGASQNTGDRVQQTGAEESSRIARIKADGLSAIRLGEGTEDLVQK
jgi:hypothetical protein